MQFWQNSPKPYKSCDDSNKEEKPSEEEDPSEESKNEIESEC